MMSTIEFRNGSAGSPQTTRTRPTAQARSRRGASDRSPGDAPGQAGERASAPASGRRSTFVRLTGSWPVVLPAAAIGVVVIGLSYRFSASGAAPELYYPTFWVGLLLALLPAVVRLTGRSTARGQRALALLLLGVLTGVPKYLRNATGPLYHDEYAHWREAVDVLTTQQLLRPNTLIPIVQFFPGTSGLTVIIGRLTGLSVWNAGELLVAIMHVAALFAIFLLAETLLGSSRAGAIAALVYAINPSAIYFDTQYAYESVAIALFCWVLALTALAGRAERRRTRVGLIAAASCCAAGAVVTHHLTTVFLIAALVIISAGTLIGRRMINRRTAAAEPGDVRPVHLREAQVWPTMLLITTVLAVAWLVLIATPTISYLSPYFGGSLKQLAAITQKHGESGRVLLAASVQPFWERAATALAPLLLGLVSLLVLVRLWRRRREGAGDSGTGADVISPARLSPAALSVMAFGMVYFPSVPFVLAPSGAEGARRSWGFTYAGLALVVALAVTAAEQVVRAGANSTDPAPTAGRLRRWARVPWQLLERGPVLMVLLVVLVVGNVGGGLNDPYRFPGPFRWGTDTNSVSLEAREVALRLSAQQGPVRVVADAYTSLQLAGYGGLQVAAPSQGFPAWDLTQSSSDPSVALATMLVESRYDYLVVDERIAEQPAFNGANYGPGDPLLGQATPQANLDRLNAVPWAHLVMSTEHLRVYRLDLARLGATLAENR